MSIARSTNNNNTMFIFSPPVASTLEEDLINKINTSWGAFAQLATSKNLAGDLTQHFNELNHIIDDINTANSKNRCAKFLPALYDKIKSMEYLHQFKLKEELNPLIRMEAKSVI